MMKFPLFLAGRLSWVPMFFYLGLVPQAAHAELPMLDAPWLGMFGVYEDKSVQIVIKQNGELVVSPLLGSDKPGPYVNLPVTFGIEETMPNGRTRFHPILPDSLESPDGASDKFKKATLTGEVEGGARFELVIEVKRGEILIGGRIMEVGTLTQNPIRLLVSSRILNFYGKERLQLKNDPEAFEALIEDDYVKLKWSDGRRKKFDFIESLNAEDNGVSGPGSEEVEVEIKAISKVFTFSASEASSLSLSNHQKALNMGFLVNWTVEAAKDPKGSARLSIEVK